MSEKNNSFPIFFPQDLLQEKKPTKQNTNIVLNKNINVSNDSKYFINKDYGSDLNSVSNVQDVMKVIDTIREPIRSMDDVNKGHTIKYIQVLSKLSELYSKA